MGTSEPEPNPQVKTPRVFASTSELAAATGEQIGTTSWKHISQQMVDAFAHLTDDHQWIHVERDRASESSFGGTIVHGYLTLSLLSAMADSLFTIEAGSARLNYGLERVRFPAPFLTGTKVRGTATFRETRRVAAGTQLIVTWILEAEGQRRPVCVADTVTLVVP